MDKEKEIGKDYQELWALATELARKDMEKYPWDWKHLERDRAERHLLGMLEMYQIRYGEPAEREAIVDFLERQLFRTPPIEDEVSRLTYDMWKDLRDTILKGEYKADGDE